MQNKGQLIDKPPSKHPTPLPLIYYMAGVDSRLVQERLSATSSLPPPERFSTAVLTAVADAEQKAVVVFCSAEDFIVSALAEGRTPSKALAEWIGELSGILRIRSQKRRQISLIRDRHLLEGDRDSLGSLQALAGPTKASATSGPVPHPLFRVLARQIVAESAEAQQLGRDLEASGLPWEGQAAAVNIDAMYLDCQEKLTRDKKMAVTLDDHAAQAVVLREQIAQLQDEIIGRVQQAGLDKEAWERRVSALAATTARERANGELALSTLRQSIKKLETELRQAKDATQTAQRHSASLEAERRTILDSTSWKITRPLRALRETFSASPGKKII